MGEGKANTPIPSALTTQEPSSLALALEPSSSVLVRVHVSVFLCALAGLSLAEMAWVESGGPPVSAWG